MPDQERSCWICIHRYPCSMAQAPSKEVEKVGFHKQGKEG